jgi:hypothetical protein
MVSVLQIDRGSLPIYKENQTQGSPGFLGKNQRCKPLNKNESIK